MTAIRCQRYRNEAQNTLPFRMLIDDSYVLLNIDMCGNYFNYNLDLLIDESISVDMIV